MSTHTPGPWLWDEDYHGLYGAGPDNAVLQHYYYEGMHLAYGEKQAANAALLAAAPDLLAVAKHAQEWTDPESVLGIRLAEVIARAEGKA